MDGLSNGPIPDPHPSNGIDTWSIFYRLGVIYLAPKAFSPARSTRIRWMTNTALVSVASSSGKKHAFDVMQLRTAFWVVQFALELGQCRILGKWQMRFLGKRVISCEQ